MFEPDEFIFTKLAYFFKRRSKKKKANSPNRVLLSELKQKLTIFSRAITGQAIEIFDAEREGGYKNNNFFLPTEFAGFDNKNDNILFYFFRILYLSTQKNLNLNWNDTKEHELKISQVKSQENSKKVLSKLFEDFPDTASYYQKLKEYYNDLNRKNANLDFSFIYGKWMRNNPDNQNGDVLKNFNENVKPSTEDDNKTTFKSRAVEEIISAQVDVKQQDDAVLQHQFEKVETAEEFSGNFRDFDGEDELESHSNALEDVNMKYTVRVDDPTHSIYQTDFQENTTIKESATLENNDFHITYDEWDYKKRKYKPDFCKVYPSTVSRPDLEYYKKTITDNKSTLTGLRKMLSTVNNKFQLQKRQYDGDYFDLDATTDLFIDIHSGHTPSENVYLSKRKKARDISILMLLDTSLSSGGYAAGNKVIDVEKQVSILFGEILNEFEIDFSIDCFYSKTRNHTSYITVKHFDEKWQSSKLKIGGIYPSGYTRIGTALRHAGARIDKRPHKNKWIIILSDGKPNDYDKYEGKYGINDVKQALRELNQRKINAYALAIEAEAKYYLPQMFGQNHYQILTTPVELLQSLVRLFERINHQ